MTASKIAPQRTFPKQLLEFVELLAVVFEAAGKFETDAFFQRKFHLILRGLTEFRVLTEFQETLGLTAVLEVQVGRASL